MTHGRVSALVVAFVVSLAVTADADAQSLSSAPASSLDPSMASPFDLRTGSLFDVSGPPEGGPHIGGPYGGGPHEGGPHSASMFVAGQIVDRPTADLRPRFHWGVIGSFVPHWSTPATVGDLFFESLCVHADERTGRPRRRGSRAAARIRGGCLVRAENDQQPGDHASEPAGGRYQRDQYVHRAHRHRHDGCRCARGASACANRRAGSDRLPRRRRSRLAS